MTKALVIGSNGQDGSLLCTLLHKKGARVFGIDRVSGEQTQSFVRFSALDICDLPRVNDLLAEASPDEVYYLAAYHHSAEQRKPPGEVVALSLQVNTLGLNNVLAAVADSPTPRARVFYAASSRVFGDPAEDVQDDNTPMAPVCAYGISKAAGVYLCRYYRR